MALAVTVQVSASQAEMPITTSSADARALYMQALEKAGNLELNEAARLADQAIAKDPNFALAYLLKAQASSAFPVFRENLDKAVSLADKVSPGERHLIMAAKAQADGDPPALETHLDQLVAMHPRDKYVQMRLAQYHNYIRNNDEKAVEHYRKSIEIDPSFAPAHNELGYALMSTGDFEEAEATFKKYISLRPDSPNPYDSYGEMLMKTGRYDDSIAMYRKALEKNPTFVASLAGIGTNQVFKKDYKAARKSFEDQRKKAADVSGRLDASVNIAMSYVDEGKPLEAARVLDEVATTAKSNNLVPRAVNTHLQAAQVLAEAGRAAEAAANVDKAKSLLQGASLPETLTPRLQAAVDLTRAHVLAAQGQFDKAEATIAEVKPAIEQRGIAAEQRTLHLVQGTVALEQKEYKEALEHLEQSDENSPYVLHKRAQALEGLGQTERAAELYAEAANWNLNDLGYAMVRSEAMKKSAEMPVATTGKPRR